METQQKNQGMIKNESDLNYSSDHDIDNMQNQLHLKSKENLNAKLIQKAINNLAT